MMQFCEDFFLEIYLQGWRHVLPIIDVNLWNIALFHPNLPSVTRVSHVKAISSLNHVVELEAQT